MMVDPQAGSISYFFFGLDGKRRLQDKPILRGFTTRAETLLYIIPRYITFDNQ